ncbi:MAG: L-histidine N(alpha)-methyltransferase [Bdellovibrionales bacterium]|nr:L-histidine N(alpha)-methyltransferase [Bdellovibrionales bacterium]
MTPSFGQDILQGLQSVPKRTHPKYLYDKNGAALFEKICDLPEYYLTRSENEIFEIHGSEIAHHMSEFDVIVEYGAGSGEKIAKILSKLPPGTKLPTYVPMDYSPAYLEMSVHSLAKKLPRLWVDPFEGDFLKDEPFQDLNQKLGSNRRRLVFFPGSTLGNLDANEIDALIQRTLDFIRPGKGAFILGVDRWKSKEELVPAYWDSAGITAQFNRNLLVRMRSELGARVQPETFRHEARFNPHERRIEMHLVSDFDQEIEVLGHKISFRRGESIHTENSHKFDEIELIQRFHRLGLKFVKSWSDKNHNFVEVLFHA